MTAETSTPSTHHRHAHRKRSARMYLVGIFVLLAVADAVLFRITFGNHNPWRLLIGVMVGQSISTLFLLGGVWTRQPWARYVLIVLLFAVAIIYGTLALYLTSHPETLGPRTLPALWSSIAVIVLANTWLIRSKRIQYLASQPGSGG